MSTPHRQQIPIAIVGVGAIFPGAADIGGFWRNILAGKDLISDVPANYWLIDDYYDPDPTAVDKTYGKRGGFLPAVDFDPMAFGVPPNNIGATDTAQLLALIVAQKVLEDACGGEFSTMARERVSVILGVASGTELLCSMASRMQRPVWLKALRESGMPEDEAQAACDRIAANYSTWQEATFPGLLGNVVAGRIANRFDLHGTNCVTDAACASSLSALNMAINELSLGQSDMVISGGVDTLNDIMMYMCFSKTPALSASGDCRPFSDEADGTILGEGLGMFALKRLEDAERDGDRVYAVVRGLGTSSDGRSTAVYAPLAQGQARAIDNAYAAAGYGPETVELLEAHGTGTKAGDAAEFGGLCEVFGNADPAGRQWCALGSVKSQIGHTKATAGAAGLLKAVLALHHKILPPTIKVKQPNPKLDIAGSPFYLNTVARPWIRNGAHPRRAGVSSFGFGGSNFHVTVEEYVPAAGARAQAAWSLRAAPTELILLSAASATELLRQCGELIQQAPKLDVIARATQSAFDSAARVRLALVADSTASLVQQLGAAVKKIEQTPNVPFATPHGMVYGAAQADAGGVGFLFSGQGSQYVGMGSDLAQHSPVARAAWDRAAELSFDGKPLHAVVFPIPVFSDAEREAQAAVLTATEWAQPALAAQSLALLAELGALGLRPAASAGHSFGELVALHAAGVMSADTLLRLARKRGELMRDAGEQPGAMLAVAAAKADIEALLARLAIRDVVVANHNAPAQVVVSGTRDAIEALARTLDAEGIAARRLRVATAFHSPIVAEASAPLLSFLQGEALQAPGIPVFANLDGQPYAADTGVVAEQLAAQLRMPVQFVAQIEAMYASGVRTFVEIGAGSALTDLVGQILGERPHLAATLDRKNKHGVTSLQEGLARLAVGGVALNFDAWWSAHQPPAAPGPAKKASMTISLTGANHGKPYPPPGGSAALPKPNPPRPQAAVAAPVSAAAAAPAKATLAAHAATSVSTSIATPVAISAPASAQPSAAAQGSVPASQSSVAAAPSVPAPVRVSPAAPAPASVQVRPAVSPAAQQHWLDAFEASQRQTADAHAVFQQSMAESHIAFLKMAEQSSIQLTAMIGGGALAQPIQQFAPAVQPAAAVAPIVAPPAAPAAPVSIAPTVQAAPARPAPPAPVAPVAPAPVAAPVLVTLAAPVAAAPDLEALMLDVVADKTGYPTEMLGMEMELEADLGIDSIKRVEILSALRELAPGLAAISPADLGKLRTLGEIVNHMRATIVPAAATPTAASTPAAVPQAQAPGNLEALMLDVVADKTGYPTEMLGMDMELEADLGIDSIKRVEILSALRELAPGLAEISPAELGKLRTLGEIVNHMRATIAPVAAPVASAPAPAATPQAQAPADLEALMLAVVADKTGYPTEMLAMEMELEADLGIDSIKRVEILSALRELAPGLAEISPAELGKLRTLGEIVNHMRATIAPAAAPAASAPAPAAASQSQAPADLEALMLAVVADKTGYPTEMLAMEMELEADLGIDSIKRVEILSALRELAPGLAEISPAELGKLRTLGEIVNHMRGAITPAAATPTAPAHPAPTPVAQAPVAAPEAPAQRFAVRLLPAQASGKTAPGLSSPKLVITDDGAGVAAELATQLKAHGHSATVVDTVQADATGVILLNGLRATDSIAAAVALNHEAFAAARTVAAGFQEHGGLFVAVQDTGGDFGLSGRAQHRAWGGGIAALVRTAAREWPQATLKVIDCERGTRSAAAIAAAICDELLRGGADVEVGLREQGPRAILARLPARLTRRNAATPQIDRDSVLVVTGGARGVTAVALIALAKECQPKLVLIGRTELSEEPAALRSATEPESLKHALIALMKANGKATPAQVNAELARLLAVREIRATLDALAQHGSQARYLAVDVQDAAALQAGLADVRHAWGPITGIVHGAGVLADRRIADKTDAQFQHVFQTKVAGLRALLDATAQDPLTTICLFSSIAASTGNIGQSDYAMANEVLNQVALSEQARRPGCAVSSIGWGPWQGGMVNPTLAAHFEEQGVALLPLTEGARAFVDELVIAPKDVQVLVIPSAASEGALGAPANHPIAISHAIAQSSHDYLHDHAIAGTPVVPLAMALEWLVRMTGVWHAEPGPVTLRHVRVLRKIALTGFSAGDVQEVQARALMSSDDGHPSLAMELTGADHALYYRAGASFGASVSERAAAAVPTTLTPFERPQVYDGHVLFHGPRFQAIERLEGHAAQGAAAVLIGSGQLGWPADDWHTDPALLDGGLQLAVLWAETLFGGASLPMAVGELRLHRTGLATGPVRCVVRALDVHAERASCDIAFYDADGAVRAELLKVDLILRPDDAQSKQEQAAA